MISDRQPVHAVAIHLMCDCSFVSHCQVPRSPDLHTGRDSGIAANLCTEETQQHSPPAKEDSRRPAKDCSPHDGPQNSGEFVSERVLAGTVEFADVEGQGRRAKSRRISHRCCPFALRPTLFADNHSATLDILTPLQSRQEPRTKNSPPSTTLPTVSVFSAYHTALQSPASPRWAAIAW